MKIRITEIHPKDAWYADRLEVIGLVGEATKIEPSSLYRGYYWVIMKAAGKFYRDVIIIAYAKYEKVEG